MTAIDVTKNAIRLVVLVTALASMGLHMPRKEMTCARRHKIPSVI